MLSEAEEPKEKPKRKKKKMMKKRKTKERVFGQLRGKLALEVGSLEHHQTRNSGEKSHPALSRLRPDYPLYAGGHCLTKTLRSLHIMTTDRCLNNQTT